MIRQTGSDYYDIAIKTFTSMCLPYQQFNHWNKLGQKRSDYDTLFVFGASKKCSENNNSSWLLIYEQINIHNPSIRSKIYCWIL